MQITDVTCLCGAEYERAEVVSSCAAARPICCEICGAVLEAANGRTAALVAFRLVLPPDPVVTMVPAVDGHDPHP
jgi:hypothetical protein